EQGVDFTLVFHPKGNLLAATLYGERFVLLDARTLRKVFECKGESSFSGAPSFFLTESENPVDVLAGGQRLEIADGQATVLERYPKQPDAITPPPIQGLYI